MPKPPVLKDAAKEIVLSFLRSLYYKKAYQKELTPEESSSVRNVSRLANYLSKNEQFKIHIYKKGSNFNDYKEYDASGFIVISDQSFRNALKELTENGLIETKDNQIQYIPKKDEQEQLFPILKMAKSIEILPLPWNDLAFFKVRRGLSSELANYINQQFFDNDIYAVSLGDVVMCIDIAIPNGAKIVSKRNTVHERVKNCLAAFDLKELSIYNDNEVEIGFTPDEIMQKQMDSEIAQFEEQQKQESETGGKIKRPSPRRIKR